MALPLDNPSYFVVPNGTLPCPNKGKFRLFKKKMGTTSSQEVISEIPPYRGGANGRMPLRTLLRSVSSNSADSNQELLVLGEPRPSDIAPPSPCLSSFRDDNNRKLKKPNKSRGELMSNELTYSPLATSEEAADEIFYSEGEEEEEVFLTEDSAKYYNLSAPRETGRRHSVGTYLIQERERALSIASSNKSYREEAPQATVHATIDGEVVKPASITLEVEQPRRAGSTRRRCNRCTAKGSGCTSSCSTGMDDIVIVSSKGSQAAALWVNYFGTCFDQISRQKNRPNLKVFQLGIEEINDNAGISPAVEQRISSVKLNVVIVCPQLLDYVAAEPKSSAALCSLLKPDRTIAMLLGVTDETLSIEHHTALVSYKQWIRHQVGQDQDQEFARDFLSAAMGILTKVARQQQAAAIEERTTFSVMPKKVKQNQNRMIVLLAEPLNKDDTVRVSVDKNGDMIEVKSVKRRNPYTLKFTMPDSCLEVSSIVNVVVEKNGNVLGARPVKCESRLREMDQILRSVNDPVEFMCQTLGFSPSNGEQLDAWMVHAFQRNLPPHFNLLAAPGGLSRFENGSDNRQSGTRHPHGHEEYPTLLHFAAKYGLEKLAWQLLECPGAEAACELRNAYDLMPAEIAENAGYSKLASALKGYMQMSEFTNMYSQLKELTTTKQPPPDVDEDEYLLPRIVEPAYSIPPPAKPYEPENKSNVGNLLAGYLEMQPLNKQSNGRTTLAGKTSTLRRQNDQINVHPYQPTTLQAASEHSETNRSESSQNDRYEDKVQGELLEIMNDFKNNVFTMTEVEHLVENWHKRNDVQKSFKEKEEQLNSMRREYERIQQMMKEEMKRPTPFERIKIFFTRSPKNKAVPNKITHITRDVKLETSYLGAEEKTNNDAGSIAGPSQLRPISSLSLQSTASSSSSGRMSTLSASSAASFGDSGTHSDHEDRKHLMRQTSNDHEYFEINDSKKSQNFNYLIPPAPKPVHKYNTTKQHNSVAQQFNTINERPPHPVPRVDTASQGDQYYIEFPPSGLPVNAPLNGAKSSSPSPMSIPEESNKYLVVDDILTEYMNLPASENLTSPNESLPEYMNFQPPALPPRRD